MVEIILSSRYFVMFVMAGEASADAPSFDSPCATFSRMEAYQLAARGTDPEFPFAAQSAVVERSAHPSGNWGEHSCARFVAGKMVFPFT
jgi:hypothetical protein